MSKRKKQTTPNPMEKSENELLKGDIKLLEQELTKSYEQIASLNRQKGGYIASNNAYRKRIIELQRSLDVEFKMFDVYSNKLKELAADREDLLKVLSAYKKTNKELTYTLYIVSAVIMAVVLYLIFN